MPTSSFEPSFASDAEVVVVAVVGERPLIGYGLQNALRSDPRVQVLGELVGSAAAVGQLAGAPPAVVLVDLDRAALDRGEVIRQLVAGLPGTSVLVLGESDDPDAVTWALACGAGGYLTHDARLEHLVDLILRVAQGRTGLTERHLTRLVRGLARDSEEPLGLLQFLTSREREVLVCLTRGRSTREISDELHVSVNTVRTHTQNILTKLGVHSKLEAAAYAVRYGQV